VELPLPDERVLLDKDLRKILQDANDCQLHWY
jgi:hypothetical protein